MAKWIQTSETHYVNCDQIARIDIDTDGKRARIYPLNGQTIEVDSEFLVGQIQAIVSPPDEQHHTV